MGVNVGRSKGISSNAVAEHGKPAFRDAWRGGRRMRMLGLEEIESETTLLERVRRRERRTT